MTTILKYNFVNSDEENGVLTAGFADEQFDTKEYLLFQNWIDAEAEGEEDEIYMERDGQSQGTYEGINKFILFRDNALLSLSAEAAQILDTEQEISILFSATDDEFQKLKKGLEIIFANRSNFEVRL